MCSHTRVLARPLGLLLALASMLAVGCETEDGDGNTAQSAQRVAIASWNAGLAYNFVPLTKERRESVIAAAAGIDADVVCLQEVWTDDDVAAVTAAAKAKGFAHILVEPTKEDVAGLPTACTAGDTKDLEPCATTECGKSDSLVACVQSKCGKQLAAISEGCFNCLVANLEKDLAGIFAACAKGGGGAYSFGGHHGLMLLSKRGFAMTERTMLDSTLVRRAVLHARLEATASAPALEVYCTHLTAGLSSVAYKGSMGSWEQEQGAQIDALGKHIASSAKAGDAVVLLGDLNCGPDAGTKVKAEMGDNWKKITALGFVDPYLTASDVDCTFCGDNTLVASGADKGGEGALIDHIALRGWTGKASVSRILDQKVTIATSAGQAQSHVSDHFGLRALLTK